MSKPLSPFKYNPAYKRTPEEWEKIRKAEERGEIYPHMRNPEERCPPGYHLVLDHFKNRPGKMSMALEEGQGVYVQEHCAKNPRRRNR